MFNFGDITHTDLMVGRNAAEQRRSKDAPDGRSRFHGDDHSRRGQRLAAAFLLMHWRVSRDLAEQYVRKADDQAGLVRCPMPTLHQDGRRID